MPDTSVSPHRVDCSLKTEETDAKASAGDVMRFATHDNLLSIQNADPLNGVGEPVTGSPVTNRSPSGDRVKRTVAASDGPALRTQEHPREHLRVLGATAHRSWKPFGATKISTESLILAQDERWRRA